MSAGKLQSEMSDESKRLFGLRCVKDQVILLDWNSGVDSINFHIQILKTILLEVSAVIRPLYLI